MSLATAVVAISVIYFGKEVLIPFALALLLSFLLAPPVGWLEKLRLGRAASVVLVLVITFSAVSAIVWLGATQLADIASNLPQYQLNVRRKIEAMRNPAGNGLAKIVDTFKQLNTEMSAQSVPVVAKEPVSGKTRAGRLSAVKPAGPIDVELVKPDSGLVDSVGVIGVPLLHVLGVASAVLIFTLFMLMQRSDLRNRLFRLFGLGHLNLVTTAMDDAAQRVSRYLLTQCIVNGTFGFLLGLGLYCIGVPNAPFWGVLGAVLRFVPYVGTLIAGLCPLVLALAVFEGWMRPLLTFGLFATIELTLSAAIEPWLYGAHTGISALAILISAAFWTLLWGPIGLVLSTPLTVCLLVLGRYVPGLNFLNVLIGDEPVLPPQACYYQRLLALDEDEAQDIAKTYLQENTLEDLYGSVLVPALALAERDRHQNALDEERESFIYESTKNLIEELSEDEFSPAKAQNFPVSELSILCVPARDAADELVGFMLAHLLRQGGYKAEAISLGTVEDMLAIMENRRPNLLFVSALPPFALTQARALCRRARKALPNAQVMVGFWQTEADLPKLQQRLGSGCFDSIVTTLPQAQLQVKLQAGSAERQPAEMAVSRT